MRGRNCCPRRTEFHLQMDEAHSATLNRPLFAGG
jgi:hypothetical protein